MSKLYKYFMKTIDFVFYVSILLLGITNMFSPDKQTRTLGIIMVLVVSVFLDLRREIKKARNIEITIDSQMLVTAIIDYVKGKKDKS